MPAGYDKVVGGPKLIVYRYRRTVCTFPFYEPRYLWRLRWASGGRESVEKVKLLVPRSPLISGLNLEGE